MKKNKKTRNCNKSNKRDSEIIDKKISMHKHVYIKYDINKYDGIGIPSYAKKRHAKKRNHRRKK